MTFYLLPRIRKESALDRTKICSYGMYAVLQIRRTDRDNLGIIIHISPLKTYFVVHHQNRLIETTLMMGHNICFW